ncbi:M81 family metallopeptidase [Aquibaculum arenosum]|uniref:Microcystinase C n=1 Tax=Aquibaculum arenosum TaxID=3032591 RepID=A0ABT5YP06_9PROT|nr:M81 family metallopeptidase [Fodinicurvata sp. CAU 1616]MDF2096695.1 M81 family metallopeptidase [Fodinicurvata sp. CAU 1616]
MKIAVGGFQHETNTFAPTKADYAAFAEGGGWPPVSRGEEVLAAVAGMNLPIAGFTEAARTAGHQVVPLTWAAASPSSYVTEDAFERICGQIIDDLAGLRGVDAVYLDLHGAMVTEHFQDGEGEILRRVRATVGRDLPVVTSLDLHANVTPEIVALSDGLVIYRTYPHVDMAKTGERAFVLLSGLLQGRHYAKAYRQLPFLIPLTGGCTLIEPAASIYAALEEIEAEEGLASISFACGFGPADIHHCGPSLVAYGGDAAAAERAADRIQAMVAEQEAAFGGDILPAAEAVREARAIAAGRPGKPVVLADTQDNPGAGGDGDTVGLLEALVEQSAEGAVLGLLIDRESAERAHMAGADSTVRLELGAKSGQPGHKPLVADFKVLRLGDGAFTCTGPFYEGARMRLGPMALLELNGVQVAVASKKVQAADMEMFRHLGVEPTERPIVAVKSSVHFRAHFQPVAERVIVAAAPGPNPVDHSLLTYRNLRPGVRLMPAKG